MTAYFFDIGSKDKTRPGFFLRFGAKNAGFMAGCYNPDKDQLMSIRRAIAASPASFKKIARNSAALRDFGDLMGESNKRIPSEFADLALKEPLIARKQFYMIKEMDADLILSPELLKKVMQLWKVARPLNQFLEKALQS